MLKGWEEGGERLGLFGTYTCVSGRVGVLGTTMNLRSTADDYCGAVDATASLLAGKCTDDDGGAGC